MFAYFIFCSSQIYFGDPHIDLAKIFKFYCWKENVVVVLYHLVSLKVSFTCLKVYFFTFVSESVFLCLKVFGVCLRVRCLSECVWDLSAGVLSGMCLQVFGVCLKVLSF